MIKTLTYHCRRMPGIGKVLLGILSFLVIFAVSFKFLYADNISFGNQVASIFSWLNTWQYSNTYFRFWGNNFVGIIFWQTGTTLSTWEVITINGWAQAIRCTEKLRGIYYNNQRGRRIWPLDTGNLAILSGQGSGYGSMTMTNGLFTNCTWVSWWYVPLTNEVYGQIDHTFGLQDYRMIAWVNYNFTGNAISWLVFGHTLTVASGWIYSGYLFDTNGGIAEVTMGLCQWFTSSPSTPPAIVIQRGSWMTFTCYGNNAYGYALSIATWWATSSFYTNVVASTGASQSRTTWQTLATWDYVASCAVLRADETGPQCWNNISFHVWSGSTPISTGWTGICDPNFQGEITFSAFSGSTVINTTLGTYYTNSTGITLQIGISEPAYYNISGNFLTTPLTGNYTGTSVFDSRSTTIVLSGVNMWNNFSSSYVTWSCTYIDAAKRVYVDTVPPSAPYISLPINGTNMCPSTPATITRSGSSDSGSQLAYYKYEIYNNSWMTTGIMLSGSVPSNVTSISSFNISLLPLGTYYMRIQAVDNVNMSTNSNTVSFTLNTQYCTWTTGVVIVTPTIWLRNVNLDKIYRSDPIWVLGLTGPTLVSVSHGMLFINGSTGGNGTTGMITSRDSIYIELVSSDTFDTTVSSTLSILGLTWTFSLTTKKSNCVLSTAEQLVIQNVYENLKDEYDNNISKLSEFLNTFQNMVQDESELSDSCTLEYLLALIEDDIGFDWGVDTSNHITPNCKEYSIGYDSEQKAYYAPEMMNRYYFVNRESLIRHLDYYNPGDCHINTYGSNFWTNNSSDSMKHIAPNGKIYHFVAQYGGFSASEFTSAKYFDSLANIVRYVDLRNPAKEIWKHTLDTSFTPIVYAAPNGKEYTIYKTDRWYMSYKLLRVKYYTSISELKSLINKNNPSKW